MGKTRLAIEIAQRQQTHFIDGLFFVPLAPLSDPTDIAKAIAEAINHPPQHGIDPQTHLLTYLKQKQILLILDNFEHLIAGANLLQTICQTAPQIKLLVTSRQRLHLTYEHMVTIEGMAFPTKESPISDYNTQTLSHYSAITLFQQAAQRTRLDFEAETADWPHIVEICRLAQGMPLGILLAAAWIDMLSPAEIAAEMAQSSDFLQSPLQDIPQRQQSMRSIFLYNTVLI